MADRFWVGGSGNLSDDTNHWATTTGGSAGGGNLPVAGDNAIFDSNSGGGTCTFDQALDLTTGTFDMVTGNVTAVDTSGTDYALSCSTFNACDSLFTANGSTVTVSGDVKIVDSPSLFASGTSTFIIDSTGTIDNPRTTNGFNILQLTGAITTTLISAITVRSDFQTGTGTITDDGVATRNIVIEGLMTNQGPTWTVVNGLTLIWSSTSVQTIPADDYGAVGITMSNSGVVSLGGNVTCGGFSLIMQNGLAHGDMVTYNLTCTSVTIGGNNSSANGQFDCGSGTLTVSGNVLIRDSNFGSTGRNNSILGESATINVAGNWTIENVTDAGVFTPGTSTVTFNATSGTKDITLAGNSFNDVTINDAAGTAIFELQDAFSCIGTLLITDGIFQTNDGTTSWSVTCNDLTVNGGNITANASTITVSGSCVIANVSGLFTRGTSTIDLTGTGNLSNPHVNNIFNLVKVAANTFTTTATGLVYTALIEIGAGTFALVAERLLVGSGATGGAKIITVHASATITATTGTIEPNLDSNSYTMDGFTSPNTTLKPTGGVGGLLQVVVRALSIKRFDMITGSTSTFDMNDFDLTVASELNLGFNTTSPTFKCGNGIITTAGVFIETVSGTPIFDMEASTIICTGNWTVDSGALMTAGTSIVTLNGTGTQTITMNGQSFNKITVNGSSQTVVFADLLTTTGKLKIDTTTATIKEGVTHVINEIELRGSPGSLASLDSGDATTTATINLATDSRATYTAFDHITVTTQKIEAFKSRGCTDGGNNGGFAGDVGVDFGFLPAVNQFLTTPVPPHEFVR